MRKIRYFILLLTIICLPITAYASGNEVTEVASELELEECLRDKSICKLIDDIAIRYTMGSYGDTILDLNGHTISPTADMDVPGGFIVVERGSHLTINDTTGKGIITTGANNDNVWAAIQLLKEESTGDDLAELTINGGTIEGYYYGIMGNERKHNTKITINDGIIKGLNQTDSIGIYQPQIGELIINGGTIKGGSGIEIRSGTLTVNNGTIEGTAPFKKTVNENSSTTNGVGIAIAQHITKNTIQVFIHGGNISGEYAFYEWNPHNNSQTDLDKIDIQITNGIFKSTLENGLAVYSQNFTKFISGGSFNTAVTEYLADNAQVASKIIQNDININKKESNKTWIFLIVVGFIIAGISGIILWKRKKM